MIKPNTKVPNLKLNLINGTEWSLQEQRPENFTVIFFYRGKHCPVCKKQLEDVANHLDKLSERGTHIIAVSMDTAERAKSIGEEWDITSLPVGYEMTEEKAREWGLYISSGIKDEEPNRFSEPGMFIIRPNGTLYGCEVQSMPFTRPKANELVKALDFILDNDYPARGVE